MYTKADNDSRTPRNIAYDLARAEAAATIVKAAREWAAYVGTENEGTYGYTRAAGRLADAVEWYEKLLAEGE